MKEGKFQFQHLNQHHLSLFKRVSKISNLYHLFHYKLE